MSREVRRVPADWRHPKDKRGRYVPLHEGPASKRIAEWDEGAAKWAEGLRRKYPVGWVPRDEDELKMSYEEWDGERPDPADYMPDWPEAERTHLQMYECTSEGTPISPVMATAEDLARWLADTGASAFASMTATYEQWLATIGRGWAPSMIYSPETGAMSGVAAETVLDGEKAADA